MGYHDANERCDRDKDTEALSIYVECRGTNEGTADTVGKKKRSGNLQTPFQMQSMNAGSSRIIVQGSITPNQLPYFSSPPIL